MRYLTAARAKRSSPCTRLWTLIPVRASVEGPEAKRKDCTRLVEEVPASKSKRKRTPKMASASSSLAPPPPPSISITSASGSGSGSGSTTRPSTSRLAAAGISSGASFSSSSYTASSSTYVPLQRRQLLSLHGTDDRVVLDIGSRFTTVGFSGESRPRAALPSYVPPSWSTAAQDRSTAYRGRRKGKGRAMLDESWDLLWSGDLARCKDESERRALLRLLEARLEELLRVIYTQ